MLRPLIVLLGTVLASAGVSGPAVAAASAALEVRIPRSDVAPPLVPNLDAAAWKTAARVELGYDRLTHGASAEKTDAYLLTDGKSLYVGFDAVQTRTAMVMNQHTNNVGVDTDDEVKVALWPGGSGGFAYQFIATPAGTRYQVSTENANYEPTWDAVAATRPNGYTVVMRIPLSIMRGSRHDAWLLQLSRWEVTTGSLYLWSGGENIGGTGDTNYARPLRGMPDVASARPKPRAGVYGLAAFDAKSIGGFTSRTGADIAIPITNGTSVLAAIHPDFSGVENDQQSISPTAFRRYYNETRPFFTQGANFYNVMECDACPNEMALYTPSIPTPRDGYAIEGHEGRYGFGAFDAVGVERNDNAQSLVFRTKPRNLFLSAERVSTNQVGLRDTAVQFAGKWDDLKHKFIYANYGTESGTLVTNPGQAKFAEIGAGDYGAFHFTGGGFRRIGAQYNPVDGFFSNSAIAGWSIFSIHNYFPTGGFIKQLNVGAMVDRYQDTTGKGPALADNNAFIDLTTRKLWEFNLNTGSSYFLIGNTYAPINQQSQTITYGAGTASPTTLSFATGIFGDGRLNAWNRSTTFVLSHRYSLTLQAYDTQQFLRNETNTQWLERFSVAVQQDKDTSFAVGLRFIKGAGPLLGGQQDLSCVAGCSNVSFAYHKRFGASELYAAYGDPSLLTTRPQLLFKIIRYVGAEKGT